MTAPSRPAERETPAGEAMREAEAIVDGICERLGYGTRLVSLRYAVASELARLTAERDEARRDAFSLAANQCEGPMHGDDYGNPYCPKLRAAEAALSAHRAAQRSQNEEIARLRAAVKPFAALSFSFDGFSVDPAELVVLGRCCGRFNRKEHDHLQKAIDAARAALAKPEPTDV